MTLLMILVAGWLCSCGAYLMMSRKLSRIVIGVGLLGHGVNVVLIMSGGDGGDPAFAGEAGEDALGLADPLPQAFVLTAIVITFGVIAFLLALAYRSWWITSDDEVEDDIEDRRIAHRGETAPGAEVGAEVEA